MEQNNQNAGNSAVEGRTGQASPVVKKRGRRKKSDSAKVSVMPAAEKNSAQSSAPIWFSVASNLAILIALFTIVFAAHKGLQNNKVANIMILEQQDNTVVAVAAENASAETDVIAEQQAQTATEENVKQNTEPKTIAQSDITNAEAQIKPDAESPSVEAPAVAPVKAVAARKETVPRTDPYTDGGPLDLDRRENIVKRASEQMHTETRTASNPKEETLKNDDTKLTKTHSVNKQQHLYTDINNPWNGRGDDDLDSPKNRELYKKSFIESTSSAK